MPISIGSPATKIRTRVGEGYDISLPTGPWAFYWEPPFATDGAGCGATGNCLSVANLPGTYVEVNNGWIENAGLDTGIRRADLDATGTLRFTFEMTDIYMFTTFGSGSSMNAAQGICLQFTYSAASGKSPENLQLTNAYSTAAGDLMLNITRYPPDLKLEVIRTDVVECAVKDIMTASCLSSNGSMDCDYNSKFQVEEFTGSSVYRVLVRDDNGAGYVAIAQCIYKDLAGVAVDQTGASFAASSSGGGTNPADAFDGSAATSWESQNAAVYPEDLEVQFAAVELVGSVDIQADASTAATTAPLDFDIQYFDGNGWTSIGIFTGETAWANGETRNFNIGD